METATDFDQDIDARFDTTGCVGHILRTARGFRACDANDKEIGVFETTGLGIAALLEVATDAT
jgi:hypothetical protein